MSPTDWDSLLRSSNGYKEHRAIPHGNRINKNALNKAEKAELGAFFLIIEKLFSKFCVYIV